MDEVSEQLKGMKKSPGTVSLAAVNSYVPPVSSVNVCEEDLDYREKKKSK